MRQLLLIAIGCLFARSVHGQFRQQSLVTTPLSPFRRVENGVTALTHDKHAFERAAQLGLVGAPITVVNDASGDATFDLTGAGSVALLGDGRLMTSGLVGSRLLVFGADGRGQTMIGRQGQGPGEFTGGNNVFAVRGDTLLLPDDVNVRINWVVPDGRVVRMKPRGNEMHSSREQIIGRFPNGALAVFSSGTLTQYLPAGMTRSTASVFTLSPDGHASLVAQVPDLEMVKIETHYRGRKESVLMPPGLGLHALAAMLETFVVVTAANAYVPDVVDQHARLVSRNVVDNPRRVVNKSMRDADLIWQLRRLHGP